MFVNRKQQALTKACDRYPTKVSFPAPGILHCTLYISGIGAARAGKEGGNKKEMAMLKTSKAVVAALLIAGSASAAFADGRFDINLYHANPTLDPIYAQQYPNAQYRSQDARGAFAYAPRAERGYVVRGNPAAIYENGQYVGQDPDINVRSQLLRETPPQ